MTELTVEGPLPVTERSVPFGTAMSSGEIGSLKLADFRYVEQEFLVHGYARLWYYDDRYRAVATAERRAFTTRLLIRRPVDSAAFGGVLQVEPLHPALDRSPTWDAIAPLIMRRGDCWAGITVDPAPVRLLREGFDPIRYSALSIPDSGLGWELLGQIASLLRSGDRENPLCDVRPERAYLSGWSYTGSFCRVFLQDGFHNRFRMPDGSPILDGYLIGISSGAARGGYIQLSAGSSRLPVQDDRRIVRGADVPVFEFMSEFEAETHLPALREDSDSPRDRYRLYQAAGTAHGTAADATIQANQLRSRGLAVSRRTIAETPVSNWHRHTLARCAYRNLDSWVVDGTVPPRAARLKVAPQNSGLAEGGISRDVHGNATGGLRGPWVDVPVASYLPHSTPADDMEPAGPWEPNVMDAGRAAYLTGHQRKFTAHELLGLYGSHDEYVLRVNARVDQLVRGRCLLAPEGDELIDRAARDGSLRCLFGASDTTPKEIGAFRNAQ